MVSSIWGESRNENGEGEACKLYEDGVCSLEECDLAMEFGYNTQGPVKFIQDFEPDYIAQKLTEIAEKYGYSIFRPTETIKSGNYKFSK